MPLITSISGIRGTIGGSATDGLTPLAIARFTSAFGTWVLKNSKSKKAKVVIGRDARISGEMVRGIVVSSLNALGIDVIDLGLSTTPTVEVAVPYLKADGGIIITASHNPKEWNALKLLNRNGEFISEQDGTDVLQIAREESYSFAPVLQLGSYKTDATFIQKHIKKILALSLVDVKAIRKRKFKVVIDCVNSTGGIAVPLLLNALGVKQITKLFTKPDGNFPHNPEPLPENLQALSKEVRKRKADVGIAVDPDVDRLALVCEDGGMFGEEYTLVSVADYVLGKEKGAAISNLSSTRALRDVAERQGQKYFASAVGEVNVVTLMKEKKAAIGGEGNGGIIYPKLHYGRDALVGIALFLSHLAKSGKKCTALRKSYPDYFMSKKKIELADGIDVNKILGGVRERYSGHEINTSDGIKIDFSDSWVHLRKSNTEPIVRVYTEAQSKKSADELAEKIIDEIIAMVNI